MKILLVEDDAAIARAERRILHDAGFECVWCETSDEALETIDSSFHGVITDRHLGMTSTGSGEDIVRAARDARLPVIMVTSDPPKDPLCPVFRKADLKVIVPGIMKAIHDQFERGPQKTKLVSTIRVEVLGGHAHIGIWNRGGKAGQLVIDEGDVDDIVGRLRGPETNVEIVK